MVMTINIAVFWDVMPFNIGRCVQLLHRHVLVQTSGQQW